MSVELGWDLRYPAADLVSRYRAEGWWTDDTMTDVVFAGLPKAASATCRVRSQTHPFEGTVGEVWDMGLRLARALAEHGVGVGDIVAFQIPNWVEAAACLYGLLPLGVVVVPIVHIYGSKEVSHILRQSRARVLITADRFGRQDYVGNLESCVADLPDLELVILVSAAEQPTVPTLGPTALSWQQVISSFDRLERPVAVDPDSPVSIGYTSGTTADPKGVIHTHRSLLADLRTWAAFAAQEKSPPLSVVPKTGLIASPLGHITGFMSALRPMQWGTPLDLLDLWDPSTVLRAMTEDGASIGGGATFFLLSLIDHPDFEPALHVPFMARLVMGGSAVPGEVALRAAGLGISVVRAYGSTEHPSTTGSLHSDPPDKKTLTDGRLYPGSEIRLQDPDGHSVPAGQAGEIYSRGPELFVGYTDPVLTAAAIDRDGWYDTGDIGVLDEQGYLTITDRKKDIIIRGGENVSAAEVEELILRMGGVTEVAVVSAPDPRYGEHGAALVRLQPKAADFDLAALRDHLAASGLARQKWPEELRFVEEFPRTPSGKIQKHVLRSSLKAGKKAPVPFEIERQPS
jgi:acyl-CoA synthetase